MGPMHGVHPNANASPMTYAPHRADRLGDVQPLLAVQERDRRDAEEMQTHDDDDDPGDGGERTRVGADERTNHAGARTKRHKDSREAENEQDRC